MRQYNRLRKCYEGICYITDKGVPICHVYTMMGFDFLWISSEGLYPLLGNTIYYRRVMRGYNILYEGKGYGKCRKYRVKYIYTHALQYIHTMQEDRG